MTYAKDPTAPWTPADYAYRDAAEDVAIYNRRLDELARSAASATAARFEHQFKDGYDEQWLFEAIRETIQDAFPVPVEPEHAAEDAASRSDEYLSAPPWCGWCGGNCRCERPNHKESDDGAE